MLCINKTSETGEGISGLESRFPLLLVLGDLRVRQSQKAVYEMIHTLKNKKANDLIFPNSLYTILAQINDESP